MSIDTSKEAVEALLTEATEGPWQIRMRRHEDGETSYVVMQHFRTGVAVDPRGYWADGYSPTTDEDGYFQPDANMDCSQFRVANALFMAAARDLVPALLAERDRLRAFLTDFAAAKFAALPIPAPRHPAEEPDPITEAAPIWQWQEDAKSELAKSTAGACPEGDSL